MRFTYITTSLALLAAMPFSVHAGKAHTHGEGTVEVVMEVAKGKGNLSIRLELPLDVVIGFERAPRTEKEKADLAAAEKLLADTTLFTPAEAAQCSAQPVALSMPRFEVKSGKGQADHADVDVTYSYTCAAPAALKSINTAVFKHFKRLYRLEARRVGPDGQGAARLTPKQPALIW